MTKVLMKQVRLTSWLGFGKSRKRKHHLPSRRCKKTARTTTRAEPLGRLLLHVWAKMQTRNRLYRTIFEDLEDQHNANGRRTQPAVRSLNHQSHNRAKSGRDRRQKAQIHIETITCAHQVAKRKILFKSSFEIEVKRIRPLGILD